MAWGKTTRILLIWPETGEILLDRRFELLLLKRRAQELGAQLAFVTRDPEVKYYARELDIPVYRTSREAQAAHWRIRRKKSKLEIIHRIRATNGPKFNPNIQYGIRNTQYPSRIAYSVYRIPSFLLAILSVVALAGLLFPKATITLSPATKSQTITFTAFTGPTITAINPSGAIPTRPMTVIVEGRTTVETTGSLILPDQPATGRVTFTNLTDVAVIIPPGTTVLTPAGVRFTSNRQAQVPAQAGGTVDVAITAIQPGTQGNVAEGTIQSIEGTLGLQLSVTNTAPTTEGTDQTFASPTVLDQRRAYRQLLDSLRETAAAEILAQLTPGDLLLNDTPFLLHTFEETYSPAETISGETPVPADHLEAFVRLEFQTFTISQLDLQTLARSVLDASLEVGYEPVPNTLSFELPNDPEPDLDNRARWEMNARRELTATLPGNIAIDLALGQPPTAARSRLNETLPLSSPPEISLNPNWWPWMPFLPFQIEVQTSR